MTTAESMAPGAVMGDRYQLESKVGEGGMASVYRAVDLATGRRVALKRLSPKRREGSDALRTLFEREFLELSQLSHPRIVAAYDYGVDKLGPYYTMELLDGADLQRMAPLPYLQVCALGRDVCSALALIHSRGLVYRDLSPHNVRCTADGLAKLIDFGALAAMGPRSDLVGTLPCVSPEALNQRPLDARTDLYAFGATLYFTLVRRHAHPAHSVHELAELWKQRPRAPSELMPGIPRALDTLVSDLMEYDPARRPQSAAEVMERLRAIGELQVDESLQVKSAYLSRPALVGREHELQTFREHAERAKQGRGSSLRIAGASGTGLSRLLDGCTLTGKLAGLLVLHVDGSSAGTGHYAGASALARALLQEAPRLARDLAEPQLKVLGNVVPQLLAGRSDVALEKFESPEAYHRQLQPALRQWLARVAQERPLLLAINDVQRLDAPSAAFVALLAREAKPHAMLVVVTQPSDQAPPAHNGAALELLANTALPIALSALSPEFTQSLLGSVFGEVPNLELVARSVHQITGGNPRDIMALAHHLVDEAVVRYEAGSWSLPSRLSAATLPRNMADALEQRVQKLSSHARTLAYAASREPTIGFTRDDCGLLLADTSPADLIVALNELVATGMLTCRGELYRCVQRSWIAPLSHVASDAEQRAAHLGLARIFALREDGFRHAGWLVRAGEHERGLTAMYEFAVASHIKTDPSLAAFHVLLQALPEDWLKTSAQLLALYEQYQRPPRERFTLLKRMAGPISRTGLEVECFAHLAALLSQLEHDSGLDCFEGLAAELTPGACIQRALELAKERYLGTPEQARVLDPSTAIRELAVAVLNGLGSICTTSDYAAFRSLPSLVPILPLAPGIQVVHQLVLGVGHRLAARSEAALQVYGALLVRLEQPDRGGLTPAHHFHTRTRVMAGMGMLEAPMGRVSCLRWAEQVERTAEFEAAGALIRYLYHLSQGNTHELRRSKRRFELLQLEINAISDLQIVFYELGLYALSGDMTGVRRAVDVLESLAALHVAARAAMHYGRGQYHAIRGDLTAALGELEQALTLMKPGEHLVWTNAAGAHVRVLTALKRPAEARAVGEAHLANAEAQQLGYVLNNIRRPLSLALSKLAEHTRARALAEAAVHACEAGQLTGIHAQLSYEAALRVAAEAGDEAAVGRHLPRCSIQFRLAFARNALPARATPSMTTDEDARQDPTSESNLESAFALCLVDGRSLRERAELGLDFVTRHLSAKGGTIYLRRGEQLVRIAAIGEADDDSVLQPWALRQLQREEQNQHTDLIEADDSDAELEATSLDGENPALDAYTPVLLAHYDEQGFAVTGIMALRGSLKLHSNEAERLAGELSRVLKLAAQSMDSRPPA